MSLPANWPPNRNNRAAALLMAAAVVIRVGWYLLTGYLADDAFITFRYAENIASGNGFVYNVGEPVLGTSTPLYTLILAVLKMLGISPIASALFIGCAAAGLTATILYRFALALNFRRLAFLPALTWLLFPRVIAADMSGMETPLFTFWITAALYLQWRRRPAGSLLMASLAALTRPEGFLILGLLLGHNFFRNLRESLRHAILPLGLVALWLIFSQFYFASVVPHAIPAKLALYSRFGAAPAGQNLVSLLGWHHPLGIVLTLLAIIGAWHLSRHYRFGRVEIIFLAGMLLFFTFSPTHLFPWYIAPVYPIYLLLATAVAPAIYYPGLAEGRLRRPALVALFGLVILSLGAMNVPPVKNHRAQQNTLEQVHKSIGVYLKQHAHSDNIVAAEDIGYLGYYSGLTILDRDGLISPAAVSYNRDGRYLDFILDKNPDWVVACRQSEISRFLDDIRFTVNYRSDTTFASESGIVYQLYRRIP